MSGQFEVQPVYISKTGAWYIGQALKDVAIYQSGAIDEYIKNTPPAQLIFNSGLSLTQLTKFGKKNLTVVVDVAFPALHGTNGEDGALMGLLELAGIPYVGCDVASSAIAMNKVLAKQVTKSANIASTPWADIFANQIQDSILVAKATKHLKYPLFIKPAHLGSSIGITKVDSQDQLQNALEVAAHYDDLIIIEQAVNNLTEVTLPIIGNNSPIASLLEQPVSQPEGFFDFEKKYIRQGGKKTGAKSSQGYSTIPAKLPKTLYDQAVAMGLDVYKALNCSGIARVDMLIDSKLQKVYFNEVNPMPGSLYAHNWRQNGVSTVSLVEQLVAFAQDKFDSKKQANTTFGTNFLKQF